jgi:pre-mRNA-processing factor 6
MIHFLFSFAGGDDEDNFGGEENEAGLLANLAPYDQEDLDADNIYASVNQKMDERRRVRREAREQKDLKNYRKSRPKIQQQFEDIKRSLKDVTEDEWESIPEVSSIKKPKKENPKERQVPCSVVADDRVSTWLFHSCF